MAIEQGDFIKVAYTGTVKETGDIFETTYDEIAKELDQYVEGKEYGPIPIVVGGGHLLKALDDAVIGMEVGESKKLEVSPEDGFGKRDPKLVQLVPMKEFKKQGIKPYPGMMLSMQGQNAKVQSVDGGRIRVDMNHELAGKNLIYEFEIVETIDDEEDKVKSLIELHYPMENLDINNTEITIDGDEVSIKMDEMSKFSSAPYQEVTFARFRVAKDVWDNMGAKKVNFVDSFEKKEETEEETEAEE